MADNELLKEIDGKLDKLLEDFNDHRVHVEGRLTRVEARSGILALLAGAISGGISSFLGNKL